MWGRQPTRRRGVETRQAASEVGYGGTSLFFSLTAGSCPDRQSVLQFRAEDLIMQPLGSIAGLQREQHCRLCRPFCSLVAPFALLVLTSKTLDMPLIWPGYAPER